MELGFNNETARFDFVEWAARSDCLWLTNKGFEPYKPERFYIIPPPGMTAEIAGGPDDQVLDTLNDLCRVFRGIPTSDEVRILGLVEVPMDQRGFNQEKGEKR